MNAHTFSFFWKLLTENEKKKKNAKKKHKLIKELIWKTKEPQQNMHKKSSGKHRKKSSHIHTYEYEHLCACDCVHYSTFRREAKQSDIWKERKQNFFSFKEHKNNTDCQL